MEDFYELLGVPEDASADEIDRAWREQVHQYHPDVNDDTRANAQFKTLKAAHEVLSDETERAAYDRLGHETYVADRLDGLPTTRRPSPGGSTGTGRDRSERAGPDGGGGSARSGTAGGSRTDRGKESRRSRTDRSDPAGETGTSRSDSGRREGRSATGRAGATDRTRTADAGAAGDPGGSTRTGSAARSSSRGRRTGPRRPLAYGWAAIAAVSVVYLLGLQAYLRVNATALSALLEAPPATIPSVLARTHDLVAPGTFVLEAAATGAIVPLVFAVGAVGLAVGFVAVVASFGRGAAYLYAVGGVGPAAALAIGPIVAAPDGAILALSVVVPLTAVGLFLLDVGRELLAGR